MKKPELSVIAGGQPTEEEVEAALEQIEAKYKAEQPDEADKEEVPDEDKAYLKTQKSLERQLKESGFDPADIDDPIAKSKDEIARVVGGENTRRIALLATLAGTTRVLEPIEGSSFPGHLWIRGPSGAGKSFALKAAVRTFPPEAIVEIPAATARVLIYKNQVLKHRAILYLEADSIPKGDDEDSSAASAIRNIMTESCLKYEYVTKDSAGKTVVETIVRKGPAVLMTTSVHPPQPQYATRVIQAEVSEDKAQIDAALDKLGENAKNRGRSIREVDPQLKGLQIWLQAHAPIVVEVPFAQDLSWALKKNAKDGTVYRHYSKTLVLIQAVALLNIGHRKQSHDEEGRLVIQATLDDYQVVLSEFGETLGQGLGGVSGSVRAVHRAVKALTSKGPRIVSKTLIEKWLKDQDEPYASHRIVGAAVDLAINRGWLTNENAGRQGKRYEIGLGEALPEVAGMPSVEDLRRSEQVEEQVVNKLRGQVNKLAQVNKR